MDKPFRALIIQRRRRLTRLLPWLLTLGVIALAGPSWQRELPAALTPQSNVMVILQQDLAMYARIFPSRHQRMQHKIAALMQRQPGSHFGLVVYSSRLSHHAVNPGSAVLSAISQRPVALFAAGR